MHMTRAGLLVFAVAASICSASMSRRGSDNLDVVPGPGQIRSNLELDYSQYDFSSSVKGALKILEDVQNLPSCQKMAAAALIHDCTALEPGNTREHRDAQDGSDLALEDSKKLYAARLAVCELHGAGVHVPNACQSFIPTQRTTKKRAFKGFFTTNGHTPPTETFPDYEQVTADNLPACIKGLHDEGNSQGWTSYSGSLKHAAPLCHAMRNEIEKDEQINLHKAIMDNIANESSLLKEEREKTQTSYNELRKASSDLVRANEEQQQGFVNTWTRLQQMMQDSMSSWAQAFNSLQNRVLSTSDDIEHNRHEMNKVVDETSTQLRETNAQHQEANEALKEDASVLHSMIAFAAEKFKQDLMQGIHNVTQNVEQTNAVAVKNRDIIEQSGPFVLGLLSRAAELSDQLDSANRDRDHLILERQRSLLEVQAQSNKTYEIIKKVNEEAGSLVAFFPGGWLEIGKSVFLFLGYTIVFALFSFALWPKLVSFTTVGTICVSVATGLVAANIFTSHLADELELSLREHTTPSQRWGAAFVLLTLALLPRCLRFCLQSACSLHGEQGSQSSLPITDRFDNNTKTMSMRYIDEEATPRRHEFRLPINNPRFFARKTTTV